MPYDVQQAQHLVVAGKGGRQYQSKHMAPLSRRSQGPKCLWHEALHDSPGDSRDNAGAGYWRGQQAPENPYQAAQRRAKLVAGLSQQQRRLQQWSNATAGVYAC